MLFLYFSGTGNSQYIAELFCQRMPCELHSIEEWVDFEGLLSQHHTIGFCYPIYGSRMPRIMREFIQEHRKHLQGKKVVVFCTQYLFSGDGARSFVDVLPPGHVEVIYAEHFLMPNNVCNVPFLPVTHGEKNQRYLKKAEKKMARVCRDIQAGTVFRRGFNPLSRLIGVEGDIMPLFEKHRAASVKIKPELQPVREMRAHVSHEKPGKCQWRYPPPGQLHFLLSLCQPLSGKGHLGISSWQGEAAIQGASSLVVCQALSIGYGLILFWPRRRHPLGVALLRPGFCCLQQENPCAIPNV